jgi:hypothetical protein
MARILEASDSPYARGPNLPRLGISSAHTEEGRRPLMFSDVSLSGKHALCASARLNYPAYDPSEVEEESTHGPGPQLGEILVEISPTEVTGRNCVQRSNDIPLPDGRCHERSKLAGLRRVQCVFSRPLSPGT